MEVCFISGASDPQGFVNGFSRKEIFLRTKEYLTSDLQVVIEQLEKSLTEKSGHAITIPDEIRPAMKKKTKKQMMQMQKKKKKTTTCNCSYKQQFTQ